MKLIKSTPQKDNFQMPGQFEKHSHCWMLWPERNDTWRLNARPAQKSFVEIAKAISEFEPVVMGVSEKQYTKARKALPSNINVIKIPNDDSWVRDSGPTFVVNDSGKVRAVYWGFNAWGGIYSSYKKDQLVAKKIIRFENIDYYEPGIILEGGSIHVDGLGTLLTTEECLLNKNRNPHLSKIQIENYLKNYTGTKKIIWLKKGVYMDEVDGHIDNLCCFVKPGVILLLWTDDKNDPQYDISRSAYEVLRLSTDAVGNKFKIHKINQPKPIYRTARDIFGIKLFKGTLPRKVGERLVSSYINYYSANGGLIMPIFNDPNDELAFDTFKKLFPDRKIVKINAHELILGGGGIHCITKEVPDK